MAAKYILMNSKYFFSSATYLEERNKESKQGSKKEGEEENKWK